jgi:RNA polymerase sigma-70 factor, ECF subfamily
VKMGDVLLAADSLSDGSVPELRVKMPREAATDAGRLEWLVTEHFAFVWRSLRHVGVGDGDADDAAQQVFLIASRKIAAIAPGSERAFLFGTALRVASHVRRTHERRRETSEPPATWADPAPGPDEILDAARSRALVQAILGTLSPDLREVFVPFEIEGLTMAEIAAALEIPQGTVASRLRRARDEFRASVQRIEARQRFRGGMR